MKLVCLIPAVFAAPPFSLADFAAIQKQPNQIGIEPFLNGLDPAIDQMPLIKMLVGSNNKNEETDVSAEVAGTNTIVKANVCITQISIAILMIHFFIICCESYQN